MILYCDSSALIKFYIDEEDSDFMRHLLEKAEAIATVRITWAEIHAALSRRARDNPLDAKLLDKARRLFVKEWHKYIVIDVSQDVVELAGEYADTFALKGYDSVQLAAAVYSARLSGESFRFACFDSRLKKAAAVLGVFQSTDGD